MTTFTTTGRGGPVPLRRRADDPCPRVLVADHALVLPAPAPAPQAPADLDDTATAIYQLVTEQADGAAPMVAMDIAARLSYPRGVINHHVVHLALVGLLQVSHPAPAATAHRLREVLHALQP